MQGTRLDLFSILESSVLIAALVTQFPSGVSKSTGNSRKSGTRLCSVNPESRIDHVGQDSGLNLANHNNPAYRRRGVELAESDYDGGNPERKIQPWISLLFHGRSCGPPSVPFHAFFRSIIFLVVSCCDHPRFTVSCLIVA